MKPSKKRARLVRRRAARQRRNWRKTAAAFDSIFAAILKRNPAK